MNVVDFPLTPEEGQRRVERAKELIGQPFVHLPGNPPEHKVLAVIDGKKIVVGAVEMIWNDKNLIDYACGEGHYREGLDADSLQLKVLDLAEKLYEGVQAYGL